MIARIVIIIQLAVIISLLRAILVALTPVFGK